MLDRLIKDIVSESASTYVSVLQAPDEAIDDSSQDDQDGMDDYPTAFSLARFIPLLTERIHVINPFTRTFLVAWITLLDSIPDLELVYHLPAFLGGLFKFLSDPNREVQVATQACLDRFLAEIKRIAQIKRDLGERQKRHDEDNLRRSNHGDAPPAHADADNEGAVHEYGSTDEGSSTVDDGAEDTSESDWVPGQDVYVDHPKILEILVTFLDSRSANGTHPALLPHAGTSHRLSEDDIKVTALRWIDSFFEICPEEILPFIPRLLSQVLPAMSSKIEQVRQAAHRVNTSLMEYIVLLSNPPQEEDETSLSSSKALPAKEVGGKAARDAASTRPGQVDNRDPDANKKAEVDASSPPNVTPAEPKPDLDYAAAVNALTLQFLNEHEATRIAALTWLIMLHRMAPRKVGCRSLWGGVSRMADVKQVLAINDETFPALLKTLSDPSEAVVTRDLQLLSQMSRNSEDNYFTSFMVNLLQLFCTDRRLLETRGNLIIRQLCVTLSAERIYRTLADCLEKDEVSRGDSRYEGRAHYLIY